MANIATLLENQERFETQGGQRIGALLWWELGGCHISHAELESLAASLNVPPAYLPPETSAINSYKRAFNHVAKHGIKEGFMLRKISSRVNEKGETWIALVEETADEQIKDLNYQVIAKIKFDSRQRTFEADRPHEQAIHEKLELWFEHYSLHETSDIRSILQRFNKMCSVVMRNNGGIYFCPNPHLDTADAIANLIHAISPQNRVHQLPLFSAESVQIEMNEVVQLSLEKELENLKDEIDKLTQSNKTWETTLYKYLPEF
ncbi:MAG: hypothetical protein QNJ46_08005, partial [Leptolyngbyaceae cyanobacterium MO_188.B28]|nr:hypothetical protein [Leptolyngbyaceae cyanobacterium MO_188.B28]